MPAPSVLPGRANERISRKSRALFHWRAADLSLNAITGELLSITRATAGTCRDSAGRLRTVAQYQPRWHYYDLDGDGVFETPSLMIEGQRTNLVLQSENFGVTWTAIGTPTRTAAALVLGDLVLDLIGDDAAGSLEGYQQPIVYTANAKKPFAIFLAADTSTSTMIDINDATAPAVVGRVTVAWAAGVPTATPSNGATVLGTEKWGVVNGITIYRILVQAGNVTAVNTNQIRVFPASDAAGGVGLTGRVYAGGVQTEDGTFPSSYMKTTVATVTRNADDVLAAISALPRDLSISAKVARPVHLAAGDTVTRGIVGVGDGGTDIDIMYLNTGLAYAAIKDTSASAGNMAVPALTDPLEFLGQYKNHATAPAAAVAVGDTALSAFGFGAAAFAVYSNANLRIGKVTAGGADSYLYGGLFDLKIGAALVAAAGMRELF